MPARRPLQWSWLAANVPRTRSAHLRLQRLEVDRLGDGTHSRVVGMYPVPAVVFRPHPVRIRGVRERSVEIHDGIVGATGTDPAVHHIAYRLATLRIVSGEDGPLGWHDRRADDADTAVVRGSGQGLLSG